MANLTDIDFKSILQEPPRRVVFAYMPDSLDVGARQREPVWCLVVGYEEEVDAEQFQSIGSVKPVQYVAGRRRYLLLVSEALFGDGFPQRVSADAALDVLEFPS